MPWCGDCAGNRHVIGISVCHYEAWLTRIWHIIIWAENNINACQELIIPQDMLAYLQISKNFTTHEIQFLEFPLTRNRRWDKPGESRQGLYVWIYEDYARFPFLSQAQMAVYDLPRSFLFMPSGETIAAIWSQFIRRDGRALVVVVGYFGNSSSFEMQILQIPVCLLLVCITRLPSLSSHQRYTRPVCPSVNNSV